MRVKIYSNEHNAWWQHNYCGYTNDESKAGIFEIEEVNKKYPYINFNKTKEDYLVEYNGLTYEELLQENEMYKYIIKNGKFSKGKFTLEINKDDNYSAYVFLKGEL